MHARKSRVFCLFLAVCVLSLSCFASGTTKTKTVSLPVLMYHQLNPSPEAWGPYTISPEMFEDDLKFLQASGYTAVTAAQLIAYTKGEFALPAKPVLLTFDDGYESFETYALPLLEQYGMCAVLSTVGYCADIYTGDPDHNISYSFFSWPALDYLQQSEAVEIGSHTFHLHGSGERQGAKIMKGEDKAAYGALFIEDCETLESRFQDYMDAKPVVFAYPYGFYCNEAKAILVQRGYEVLLTCDQKVNKLSGAPEELLDLGRYNRPNSMSCEQLFKKIHLV